MVCESWVGAMLEQVGGSQQARAAPLPRRTPCGLQPRLLHLPAQPRCALWLCLLQGLLSPLPAPGPLAPYAYVHIAMPPCPAPAACRAGGCGDHRPAKPQGRRQDARHRVSASPALYACSAPFAHARHRPLCSATPLFAFLDAGFVPPSLLRCSDCALCTCHVLQVLHSLCAALPGRCAGARDGGGGASGSARPRRSAAR